MQIIPNDLQVVEMVKDRLSQDDAQQTGWLLDGYPRSADQAEAIEEAGIRPDVFILIDVRPLQLTSACVLWLQDAHLLHVQSSTLTILGAFATWTSLEIGSEPPYAYAIRMQPFPTECSPCAKSCGTLQVPDEELVERVTGRRLDPVTNTIYHMKFKPPPDSVVDRLIQRSDDTEDKLRNRLDTHHKNVEAVIGYYKDILVEVSCPCTVRSL